MSNRRLARDTSGQMRQSTSGAYLLLDASLDFSIRYELEGRGCEYRCLLDGMEDSDMAGQLPYLVTLERYSSATDWFRTELFGKGLGVLICTKHDLEKTVRDLKIFIRTDFLGEKDVFFRFYRPDIFNTYVPAMREDKKIRLLRGREFFVEAKIGKYFYKYSVHGETISISRENPEDAFRQLFSID
jgi:hypothetical protein